MAISADAAAELAGMAADGRLRAGYAEPRLRLELPTRIERGDRATVSWQTVFANDVHLLIASPGFQPIDIAVPPNGRRQLPDLPVGRHVIRLRARPRRPQHGMHAGNVVEDVATIEVCAPAPTIEITAPVRIVLGERLPISWRSTDATGVRLQAGNGLHDRDPIGTAVFRPERCGTFVIIFEANGTGGSTRKRLKIEVLAPPVAIEVVDRVAVNFGAGVAIPYKVSGAAVVKLQRLDTDEPIQTAPAVGRIFIGAIVESLQLRFVATGHDGKSVARTVLVEPGLELEPIDDFLRAINGGL